MTVKIFFTTDDSWIAKGINFFQAMHTGDAKWSHVGLCFDDEFTVEASGGRLRSRGWPINDGRTQVYAVPLPLSLTQETTLKRNCLAELGKFTSLYGFGKMPLMIGDAIISKLRGKPTFWLTGHLAVKWFPICSHFVAYMLYKLGLEGWEKWREQTPDTISDMLSCEASY